MTMKAELVFIPSPLTGHLVSTVEMAKLLVHRDHRLSITILVMKFDFDSKITAYIDSLASSRLSNRIKIIKLPRNESFQPMDPKTFFHMFIESHKPLVKDTVKKLTQSFESTPDSPKLVGYVVDMFCTCMIDVANDFGVPSYMFFTSGAAFLSLILHVQLLQDEQNKNMVGLKDSDTELVLPGFLNPVPVRVLPDVLFDNQWVKTWHGIAKGFRRTKGIMVNTFMELESNAIKSFSDSMNPIVFPVGPVLNLKGDNYERSNITTWLDDQPPLSVVFLCFGSMGSFGEDQVKEIARALEDCRQRFLWSLRQPPPKGQIAAPIEYTNVAEVLPDGFLERTTDVGKVIGWAPQVAVLSHPAIGGFVSHCGWNSILESISCGVPIATWPMFAEQQFNAFQMVLELGLAVNIKMDYRRDFSAEIEPDIVSAEDIGRGIRCVMEHDSEIRKRVKEMSDLSRKALIKGGSSHSSLGSFIEHVMDLGLKLD